jgi:4,5:9,10-diseco-3-hydroxy-5,9,17-trioxoandrosta-1(10),2-diene-4-oate hydrolase
MGFTRVKEEHYTDLENGVRMHYYARGKGYPLIFLHGGGQGSGGWTNWKANLDAFANAGFWAIAPDAIGYGLSSKPENATYNLDFLVENLKLFCKAMKIDRTILLGNSMGGAMAIRFALDCPEKTEKLIVMAAGGLAPLESYRDMEAIRLIFTISQEEGGLTKDKLKRLLTALTYDNALVTEELLEERMEVAKTQPMAVFKTLTIENLAPRLPELKMPVLALWGREDKACPVAHGFELAKAVDDARLILFPHCGHWVQAEKAEIFNRLGVDFLNNRL